jgi:polygalacturonase
MFLSHQSRSIFSMLLAGAFLATSLVFAEGPTNYDVRAFGAVDDGETVNTKAIQAVIDACAEAGGGTVFFPAGRYVTGTLFLKDGVRLDLDMAATILGSTNIDDYPVNSCDFPSRSDAYTSRALIWGEGLTDVGITGHGTIDGQGAAFRGKLASREDMAEMARVHGEQGRYLPKEPYFNRPYLIRLISCSYVRVENVRLRNSAMWMQQYLNCDFVTIRGINVINFGCKNNDMIDIDGCRNVHISDCYGDSEDDAITLKSTGDSTTEHVVISNCIVSSHCNPIKAGTESAGGFKDIVITNCVVKRSPTKNVLAGREEGLAGIALEIVDGGTLERIAISNIVMEGTTAPIFMRLGNRARPAKPSQPAPPIGTFRDVTVNNIVATGASVTGCSITGLPGHPIENVSLSNIRIRFNGGGVSENTIADVPELEAQYPESTMFGVLPAYGFFARHVKGLRLNNAVLRFDRPDKRPAIVCDDVAGLRITGLEADVDSEAAIVLKDTRDAIIVQSETDGTGKLYALQGACEDIRVSEE